MRRETRFEPSLKQRKVLKWWKDAPVKDMEGIIADGAIRSGKTVSMSLSFVIWAMQEFDDENFGLCGKTIGSLRRNVLAPLRKIVVRHGYTWTDRRSDNLVIISKGRIRNNFYTFGGRDESSQDLIQGITLAGVFFDEVALMPESFVNQATGRCSVDGSKLWFNCNPEGPNHWFKTGWVDQAKEKALVYLHFTMDDNPSLSERIRARYRSMYVGVFFKRYIEGLWVKAEGLVWPMYEQAEGVPPEKSKPQDRALSIDYGTQNAFAAIYWEKHKDVWYARKCYYYSGRKEGIQKTDYEYGQDLEAFIGEEIEALTKDSSAPGKKVKTIIDPSAASFIALLRKRPWCKVIPADNDVADGIRETATAMLLGRFKVDPGMKDWFDEVSSYVWDEDDEKPVKENDHAMDATRYFVKTMHLAKEKREYKSLYG